MFSRWDNMVKGSKNVHYFKVLFDKKTNIYNAIFLISYPKFKKLTTVKYLIKIFVFINHLYIAQNLKFFYFITINNIIQEI